MKGVLKLSKEQAIEIERYCLRADGINDNWGQDIFRGWDASEGEFQRGDGERSSDGSVYVFINARRDRIKLLHMEPGGLVLYMKVLERGERYTGKRTIDYSGFDVVENVIDPQEVLDALKEKRQLYKYQHFEQSRLQEKS